MKTTAHVLVLSLSLCSIVHANAEDAPTDRPYAEGVVVDENGKPVAGVQYWSNGFRLGENGDKGRVNYTGAWAAEETDEDGRFWAVYGGAGREEQAVDVSFQHKDYAPAFLINANQKNGPYTVTLEKGIRLSGTLNGTGGEPSRNHVWTGPVRLRLDVIHREVGGFATRIPIETENDGWFETQIPTNHWTCAYVLNFAGTETRLEFDKDKPLPELRVKFQVQVEQDRKRKNSNR